MTALTNTTTTTGEVPSSGDGAGRDTILKVDQLQVTIETNRGRLSILNGVSFELARGETLGIVGESGSGKSMTANAILGLLPGRGVVSGGSIHFEGIDVVASAPQVVRALRGSRIGTIMQDPTASLNPSLRVGDQVGEPLRIHAGASRADAKRAAIRLLERVGIGEPDRRVGDYPHQFSGGMRQRIVGAAAISCEPDLIIADEPTTALDVTVQAAYLSLLESLQKELGAALIFISHDLAVVSRVCHRVAVMYAGRIVETADTDRLFTSARHPYTLGLMSCLPSMTELGQRLTPISGNPPDPASPPQGCPFAPRCPAAIDRCSSEIPELADAGDGHMVACHRAGENLDGALLWPRLLSVSTPRVDPGDALTPPTLELRAARKEFVTKRSLWGTPTQSFTAVDGIDVSVRRGETVTIVGESGSGKTTSIKMALGLEAPTSGAVYFEGRELRSLDRAERRAFHRKVQAVFQDPFTSFNPRITIANAVAEPLLELAEGMPRRQIAQRVDEMLGLVGLDPRRVRDSYPHQLSGGQRQRVAIARALSTEPDCLVLDEPVSALDGSIRVQVLNLLRDLREKTGVGILAISHDLGSVKYMSDRVLVMQRGAIVEEGTTEQIYHHPAHEYTQQLLSDAMVEGRRR